MASNTSNQRHSQGGNTARGKQGAQRETQTSMDTAHEYMESAQEYASDVAEQASEYWSQGREQMDLDQANALPAPGRPACEDVIADPGDHRQEESDEHGVGPDEIPASGPGPIDADIEADECAYNEVDTGQFREAGRDAIDSHVFRVGKRWSRSFGGCLPEKADGVAHEKQRRKKRKQVSGPGDLCGAFNSPAEYEPGSRDEQQERGAVGQLRLALPALIAGVLAE